VQNHAVLSTEYMPSYVITAQDYSIVTFDENFVPSLHVVTNLHLPFAEISSKLGHDDVSKLTPIDIAIEV
jgi:hypothetical protein